MKGVFIRGKKALLFLNTLKPANNAQGSPSKVLEAILCEAISFLYLKLRPCHKCSQKVV